MTNTRLTSDSIIKLEYCCHTQNLRKCKYASTCRLMHWNDGCKAQETTLSFFDTYGSTRGPCSNRTMSTNLDCLDQNQNILMKKQKKNTYTWCTLCRTMRNYHVSTFIPSHSFNCHLGTEMPISKILSTLILVTSLHTRPIESWKTKIQMFWMEVLVINLSSILDWKRSSCWWDTYLQNTWIPIINNKTLKNHLWTSRSWISSH